MRKGGGPMTPSLYLCKMQNREFKGVWIDREIWLHPDLSLIEKALLAEIDSFTGNEKAFYKSNETIQEEYKISRPTISKSLKKLEGMGYIKIEFNGRLRKVTYQADRKNFTGRRKESFGQTVNNLPAEGKNSTSTNTSKRKDKRTVKEQEEILLPRDSKTFADIWSEWKADRKERKVKDYTSRGEKAALHKLHYDTNGNEQHAIEAIGQAIANQWRGIFPREKKTTEQPSQDQLANYLRTGDI